MRFYNWGIEVVLYFCGTAFPISLLKIILSMIKSQIYILTIYHKYIIIYIGSSNGVAYNKNRCIPICYKSLFRHIFWRHIRDYFANHKEDYKKHNDVKHIRHLISKVFVISMLLSGQICTLLVTTWMQTDHITNRDR